MVFSRSTDSHLIHSGAIWSRFGQLDRLVSDVVVLEAKVVDRVAHIVLLHVERLAKIPFPPSCAAGQSVNLSQPKLVQVFMHMRAGVRDTANPIH